VHLLDGWVLIEENGETVMEAVSGLELCLAEIVVDCENGGRHRQL
jgi:hypothetical protein